MDCLPGSRDRVGVHNISRGLRRSLVGNVVVGVLVDEAVKEQIGGGRQLLVAPGKGDWAVRVVAVAK